MSEMLDGQKTEDELWQEYKKTKSQKIRDIFVRQYMPLVKYVAGKLAINMPSSVEYDDLVGFGQFGLLDAISKFDPDKNVKFKTYAVTRIRGSIYDELRQLDWVPRSVRQKSKEIETAVNEVEARLGRQATDVEVATELGISESEYHQTLLRVSGTSLLSLNDTWFSGDGSESLTIGDSIEGNTSLNPDVIVEREEIRRIITKSIHELPEKEKLVLILYYHEDLTLKEIGAVLKVSESRISQLHANAKDKLRAKLTNVRKGIV